MDENSKLILLAVLGGIWPLLLDFLKKWWGQRREKKDLEKIESETNNINSLARKADQETITEKAEADKIYVDTARGLMEDIRKVFEDRVIAMEERQKLELAAVVRKQEETDNQLAIIRKENEAIKVENQRIKNENSELHQENVELKGFINRLQSAIKGLKKLIEKLMAGINKLITSYEKNHEGELIPWKPILTDEEQLLFQSDFNIKDLKDYNK